MLDTHNNYWEDLLEAKENCYGTVWGGGMQIGD